MERNPGCLRGLEVRRKRKSVHHWSALCAVDICIAELCGTCFCTLFLNNDKLLQSIFISKTNLRSTPEAPRSRRHGFPFEVVCSWLWLTFMILIRNSLQPGIFGKGRNRVSLLRKLTSSNFRVRESLGNISEHSRQIAVSKQELVYYQALHHPSF